MEFLLSLPVPLLFVITMAACFASSVCKRNYSKSFSDTQSGLFFYNGVSGFICAAVLLALSGFACTMSWYTALMGALFGVLTMTSAITNLKATAIGPWAYTTVIVSLATIIPTFSGVLFWNEKLNALQIVGIVLMVVCVLLSVQNNESDKKVGAKWLILSICSALCTGFIGVMQKIHQESAYKGELNMFLVMAFAVSSVVSLCLVPILKKKQKTDLFTLVDKSKKWQWKVVVLVLLLGVGMALNNVINLYLSGVVNSAIFFPVVNGGNLVLVTLFAIVLFKEKLSLKQIIGLVCGIASVILLCLN